MSKKIHPYIKGVTTSYFYIIVTGLVAFWLTAYTLKFVSKSEYGYYTLIADILIWLNLLQFGVAGVLNAKVAQLIGKKDFDSLNKLTSTTMVMQSVSAVLIVIVGICFAFNAEKIINTEGIDKFTVIVSFIICVVSAGIAIVRQQYSAILVANKQIHIDNIFNLALFGIQVGLTVLFLNMGYSIVSLATSHLVSITLITIISYIRVHRLSIQIRFSMRFFSKDVLIETFSMGMWFSLGGIAHIFIYRIDSFFMANYISLSTVTSYYITSKLFDFTNKFFSNFVNIARPYMSQMYARDEFDKLNRLYDLFVNGTVFMIVFICSLIYLFNQWFIQLWVGQSFYLGDTICLLIAINFIFQSAILPNRALLASSLYKVKHQSLVRVLEGILKFILSIVMIRYWGIIGLLCASIISCLCGSTLFMNHLSNQFFRNSFRKQIDNYKMYLLILLLVILYYITDKKIGLMILIATYIMLAIMIWRFYLCNNEKTIIINYVRKTFKIKNQI